MQQLMKIWQSVEKDNIKRRDEKLKSVSLNPGMQRRGITRRKSKTTSLKQPKPHSAA